MADPLSIAGSVVGILSLGLQVTQQLCEYYTKYKKQCEDLEQLLLKIERLTTCLDTVKDHVEARPKRLEEADLRKSIEATIEQCNFSLQELQSELDRFETETLKGVRRQIRSATRRALYPFRASTLKKLEEEIDYTMSELSTILQLFQHVDTRNIQEDLTKVHELLRVMRADNVSEKARSWLNAPDATVNYNFACKKRQPGTGSWFVESEQYKQWLDMPRKALWLRGFAGCGKSVLSSTIIQNTILSRGSEAGVGIAFFYFTFTDQGK